MNLGQVKVQVKRQFGDEDGIQILDSDIVTWVNNAQREIANQNDDVLQETRTADVLVNVAAYDFPDNMRLLRSINYNSLHMRGMSINEFNEYIDGYGNPTNYSDGNPLVYYPWKGQFTVFPTPSQSAALVNGFTIYYLRNTVDVASDNDNLDLPDGYDNHIVEYCLANAYELDENWQAAQAKRGQFQTGTNQLKNREDWKTRETYPIITVRAEDQVNYMPGWF